MPDHPFSLTARGVSIDRADRPVLADVDLTLSERSRVAIVGQNGVGKSTLLRIIAGRLEPAQGSVVRSPPDLTVGLLNQELDRNAAPTVRELVALETGVTAANTAFEEATDALSTGAAEADDAYDAALAHWLAIGAPEFDSRLGDAADRLGFAERLLDADPRTLSGGEAGRVGLMIVVLSRFDLTLLDEPTNDLDLAGLEQLEQWVVDHDGGLAIVSHDRSFLERTVTSVLEIDENSHSATLFGGGWASFMEERDRARSIAEQQHGTYVAERDRLKARSQQQREWAAQGESRARKAPADGDKIRRSFNMAQTEKLAGKAKASLRAMERLEVVDKPWEGWQLQFTIDEAPRSGAVTAAFDRVTIRRGDFALGPVDFEIGWGERVGLVGPNGCGKSSLISALLGRLKPEAGSVTLGRSVVVGELDQQRGRLASDDASLLTVFEDLSGLDVAEARSVLAKFGLDAEAVQRTARSLSPGERTRAQLALFQVRGVNLLVLDEPTNHLDLAAIEQLESALAGYGGTLLLVSHDRRFLEAVHLTRSLDVGAFSGMDG